MSEEITKDVEGALEGQAEPDGAAEFEEQVEPEGAAGPEGAVEPAGETGGYEQEQVEEPAAQETTAAPARSTNNVAWIVAAIAALLAGLIIGAFAFNGGGGASGLDGKTAVAEADLDKPVATYTYKGASHDVTMRDVITQTGSLEAAKDADGNYRVPSADTVLSTVRNAVLVSAAEEQGITVTDDDIAAYAEQTLGTSDFASIASSYGMDESTVKGMMNSSCLMNKLRESVMGDNSETTAMPSAPPEPANATAASSVAGGNGADMNADDDDDDDLLDSREGAGADGNASTQGNRVANQQDVDGDSDNDEGEEANGESAPPSQAQNVFSKDYATYIIELAGDEWDAQADTWASPDGPFAKALSRFNISSKGATYEAATEAYYVAYQLYTEQASNASAVWTDYVNGVLSNATMNVYTLAT